MKRFLKRLMLSVVTLALFCCMTPLAFADDPTYYTVYLEPQGGVGVSTQIFVYKNSSNVYRATNLPSPTLDGYTFDGWYDDMVGGEKITTRYEFKADGQTIYAHWTVDESKSTSTKPGSDPFIRKKLSAERPHGHDPSCGNDTFDRDTGGDEQLRKVPRNLFEF